MHTYVQPLVKDASNQQFAKEYLRVKNILFNLLDSPVKYTQHIGGTRHFNYETEPILDVLVGVNNLHDITALDEKRLNYAGFYRLHHSYKKKVVMARFNNFSELKQEVRLHILQINTPLFEQYQNVDRLLSHDNEISQLFSEKKQYILKHTQTIRIYEDQKQDIFEDLCKHLN